MTRGSEGQQWSQACDSPVEALLAGLISSPVDITKMAYLVEDSMMTGLRFGRAVDADEVFASLVPPRTEDLEPGLPVVAVRERALPYLENAVLARYWQIQKGYWTKANRALHAMVKYLISSLIEARLIRLHGLSWMKPSTAGPTQHSSGSHRALSRPGSAA